MTVYTNRKVVYIYMILTRCTAHEEISATKSEKIFSCLTEWIIKMQIEYASILDRQNV